MRALKVENSRIMQPKAGLPNSKLAAIIAADPPDSKPAA